MLFKASNFFKALSRLRKFKKKASVKALPKSRASDPFHQSLLTSQKRRSAIKSSFR